MFRSAPLNSSNVNTRNQYDQDPYPNIPVHHLFEPEKQKQLLAKCNLTTPYYLRNRLIPNLPECEILDIGCGSGWKAMALAMANPGANILGIDFSATSIAMANDRCAAHNLTDRVQFQCLSLEAIQQLDRQFDMIHCDEVLSLIEDPASCLQICKTLLKPNGILRGNFHSVRQRHYFYQIQEFLRETGIFHENSGDTEVEMSREIFQNLKQNVVLKQRLPKVLSDEIVRMNFLTQGDRGFTVFQVFEILEAADLEYIQVLDWPSWNILELFENSEEVSLNLFLMQLAEADIATQLNLYDLLNPVHRLIDFWCGHPTDTTQILPPPAAWTAEQYQRSVVEWHPLLLNETVLKQFVDDLQNFRPFKISEVLPIVSSEITIHPHISACLLPLFQGQKSLFSLVDRYLQLYPMNPFTNQKNTITDVFNCLLPSLLDLEQFTYVLFQPI